MLLLNSPLRCEVSPSHFTLSRAGTVLNRAENRTDRVLEEQLWSLIHPHISRIPWGQSVEFFLDPGLAHYLVAPWQEGIGTPEELRHYSCFLASKRFPQLAGKQLQAGLVDSSWQSNALIGLIEQETCLPLYRTARRLKLRVRGVVTSLHLLLSTWSGALPKTAIFAAAGEQSSTFACRIDGQWQQVYQLTLTGLSIPQQLALVSRLTGIGNVECYLWGGNNDRIEFKPN